MIAANDLLLEVKTVMNVVIHMAFKWQKIYIRIFICYININKRKIINEIIVFQQASVYDVAEAADEELKHDAEMAASRDIKLRVLDVPQHNSR